ncbi:MAG: hypothetical protein ACYTXY_37825 [Nostoc sp.]
MEASYAERLVEKGIASVEYLSQKIYFGITTNSDRLLDQNSNGGQSN